MNILPVTLALFCTLAAVAEGSYRRQCRTGVDCAHNECCLAYARLRGKRGVRHSSRLGTCIKRGTEGAKCLSREFATPPFGQKYVCPCAEHFQCDPTGIRDIPIGEAGICRKEETGCNTDRDCSPYQCCLQKNRPIGRRKRSIFFSGTCQSLGSVGDQCYVNHPSRCPRCLPYPQMTCVPSGVIDIPLGPVGKCQFKWPPF